MQIAMGGSSQYQLIATLVVVCLLWKAEAQSECRCIRVMCLATTTAGVASLCSTVHYAYLAACKCTCSSSCTLVILRRLLPEKIARLCVLCILGCKQQRVYKQIRTSYNYDAIGNATTSTAGIRDVQSSKFKFICIGLFYSKNIIITLIKQ